MEWKYNKILECKKEIRESKKNKLTKKRGKQYTNSQQKKSTKKKNFSGVSKIRKGFLLFLLPFLYFL